MKYGLMDYEYGKNKYFVDVNFGDEIQSIAASNFLPKIDYFIDRENITEKIDINDKIKLIMNGWYMHNQEQWPPADNIVPLLISMHIVPSKKKFIENIFSERNREYLLSFGPIGTRDLGTLELFEKNNIPAYFSGCLTLTLNKNKLIKKQDYILCVDVKDDLVRAIKKQTKRKVICISPVFKYPIFNKYDKFKYAFKFLEAYQSAAAVITSRLHAAMPCLALETPVLLIDDSNGEDQRFWGLNKLVRNISTNKYISNLDFFDLNNIKENSKEYLHYRAKLINSCEKFIGSKQQEISPLYKIYNKEEENVQNLEILTNITKKSSKESVLYRFKTNELIKYAIKRKIYKQKNKKYYYK